MSEAALPRVSTSAALRAFARALSRNVPAVVAFAYGVTLVETLVVQGVLRVAPPSTEPGDSLVSAALSVLVAMLFSAFKTSALTHAVVSRRKNHGATLAESARWAIARVPNVFATMFLQILLMGIGVVLLIFPGFYASLVLFVAGPAATMESIGPVEALRRSHALATPHLGTIFFGNLLLSPVLLGGYLVAALGFSLVTGDGVGASLARVIAPTDMGSALFSVISVGTMSATSAVYAASLYRLFARKPRKRLGERVARVFE